MLKKLSKIFSQNNLAVVLIILGSLSWSMTMIKSGLCWNSNCEGGIGFWGANGHDGIWHIALSQSIKRGIETGNISSIWQLPMFSGESLKNYHIGFDLLLAVISKISSVSVSKLYFQILPPIFAISIGSLVYYFVLLWKKSKSQALWATFFVYFGGSWGWLIGKGESAFWSQQAVSTLINPPYALSLVFLLLGLVLLMKYLHRPSSKLGILVVFIFGSLIGIKAYAGILALGSLAAIAVVRFLKERDLVVFKIFIGSSLLSAIIFLPSNNLSDSLLVWQPFWFLETMMAVSDRVGWPKFYEAMINYKAGNSIKFFIAYPVSFAIFWFGNLGTRVIKEFYLIKWIKNYRKVDLIDTMLSLMIVGGVVLPLLFIQKGTPWNTIQFLYYSLFFSSILAGCFSGEYLKNNKFLSVLAILLTVPTTIFTLWNNYLPNRPPAKLSSSEIEALGFLSNQRQGVVLTYPFDKEKADRAIDNPPRPLYLYESTAYVSAYGNKNVFLEDQVNLEITNYDWKERRKNIESFYKSQSQEYSINFLKENKITYIYWLKGQKAILGESQLGIEKVFENSEVDIYRVKS